MFGTYLPNHWRHLSAFQAVPDPVEPCGEARPPIPSLREHSEEPAGHHGAGRPLQGLCSAQQRRAGVYREQHGVIQHSGEFEPEAVVNMT